jgi:ribose transport system substrate-binding protein
MARLLPIVFWVLVTGTALWSDPLTLVVIPKSEDQDYWKFVRRGVERAIREAGNVTLTWRGPAYNDDTDQQIRIVERYTVPTTSAILLCPTDRDLLVPAVKAAADRGIPVIVFDSALAGTTQRGFVATDNEAAGRLVAHDVAVAVPTGTVWVLRTTQGSASTDQRAQGFVDELKVKAPGLRVTADLWSGGSSGKVYHSAVALLQKGPLPDAVFAVNESATLGFLQALTEAGLAGKVPLWGFDASPELLQALDRGEIRALVVQDPDSMGYQAVKMALEALAGTLKSPQRWTAAVLVTTANRNQPGIQRLLTP